MMKADKQAVTDSRNAASKSFHQQYEDEQSANRACGIYHGEYWAKRAIADVLEETGIQLYFEHIADFQCRIYRKFGGLRSQRSTTAPCDARGA